MSSENDKNETSRFLGEGMSFKAKLIGILEVSEARGDRMCQEALSDLKIAIRAAGEHKQRIIINVAIDGLRLRDEKTGDSLYHHPVHKISFIAQDMTDSRAFGYIFGSPDTGHRFFGIKTDKAASQVVIAMRDLFQVVFALKKKEIELAKQNLEKNYCFNRDNSNVIPSESLVSDSKDISCNSTTKNSSVLKSHGAENKPNTPVVANLVDLEIELTNLQQGISQIERLTPSDPFNSNDPFGDSFISYAPKPILPPPPGRERPCRATDTSGNFSSKAQTATVNKGHLSQTLSLLQSSDELTPTKSHNESYDETISGDWFVSSVTGSTTVKDPLTQSPLQKDLSLTLQSEIQKKQFDVFTELDPLGTGKIKPYIHKRDFFQDLKKPKKVLNDLVNDKQAYGSNTSSCSTNINESFKSESLGFAIDPFGEDPFIKSDSFVEKDPFSKDNFNVDFAILEKEASDFVDDTAALTFSGLNEDSFVATEGLESNVESDTKLPSEFDSDDHKKISPDSDNAPKPPPRPVNNILTQPPPLPPKKQPGDLCMKPPPRPPHSDDSHYDIIPKETQNKITFSEKGPPLPAPARKTKPTQFSFEHQKMKLSVESSEDDYLTPIPFPPPKEFSFAEKKCYVHKSTDDVSTNTSFQNLESLDRKSSSILLNSNNMSLADINFMLSQLTLSGLNELATELNIPSVELSNMTLAQITNYLSGIIKSRSQIDDSKQHNYSDTFKTNFADFSNFTTNEAHDKYAVFRELEATEFKVIEDSNRSPVVKNESKTFLSQDSAEDKYAALREITDVDNKTTEPEDLKNEADLIFEESFECLSQKSDQTKNESDRKFTDRQPDVSVENKQNHKHTISQSSFDDKGESPKQFEPTNDVFDEEKLQTFDSISEGASGTSPENDADVNEAIKRVNRSDKEWTVFNQTKPQLGEKLSLQSEEGVSPWSSDSKEFGNASPPEWKQAIDSGSEHWNKQVSLKDQEKWWDSSAEPEEYYRPNRRSIDSFEDEYCAYSKTLPGTKKKQITGASSRSQAAGGHSSSSRDISPWEEEAYTLTSAQRNNVRTSENWERHSRQYFEKCRDSWDEEDDYEYDEEQCGRYFWPDRHSSRQIEKIGYSRRMKEHWANERHLCKQELERKRHCCEDWELGNTGKTNRYYGGNKRSNESVRSRKWTSNYEDPHFLRDSQDSSWEEDYHQNSPEMQSSHYINLKHRWKRPSSASEVEKNTDEIRNKQVQYYIGTTGGSDGEKERRYKANRRSRSRDTYCCEMNVHYKQDPNFTLRNYHKSRMQPQHNPSFNGNNQEIMYSKSDDFSNKTSGSRKKVRDDAKLNSFNTPSNSNVSWKFENNFVDSNESPPLPPHAVKYTFDYEQNTKEVNKPPPLRRSTKINKPKNQNVRGIPTNNSKNRRFAYHSTEQNVSRRTQRSPFEDDFSPPPPPSSLPAASSTSIPTGNQLELTENDLKNEEEDYFSPEMTDKKSAMSKKITNNNRLGNLSFDDGLKKSESVNIFVRENDPFDDDFFSENALENLSDYAKSPKNNR